MKKVLVLLLLLFSPLISYAVQIPEAFNNDKNTLRDVLFLCNSENPKYYKNCFLDFYAYDKNKDFIFIPLNKQRYKALNKEDKKNYKNIVEANKLWLKGAESKKISTRIFYYQKALEKNAFLDPVKIQLVDIFANNKAPKKALFYLWKINDKSIYGKDFNYMVACLEYDAKDYHMAVSFFEKFLKSKPENQYHINESYYFLSESYFSLAKYGNYSNYTKAIEYAKKIQNLSAYKQHMTELIFLSYFNQEKYNEALPYAYNLLKFYPNAPESYIRIAKCSTDTRIKLEYLYKAKQKSIENQNDTLLYMIDEDIALIEQKKIDNYFKTINSFVVKPDWYKIKGVLPNHYWSKRQDNFFKSTNFCISKYKGNNLAKCFEAVNKEQDKLTQARNQELLFARQQAEADFQYQRQRALLIEQEYQQQRYLQQLNYINDRQRNTHCYTIGDHVYCNQY